MPLYRGLDCGDDRVAVLQDSIDDRSQMHRVFRIRSDVARANQIDEGLLAHVALLQCVVIDADPTLRPAARRRGYERLEMVARHKNSALADRGIALDEF